MPAIPSIGNIASSLCLHHHHHHHHSHWHDSLLWALSFLRNSEQFNFYGVRLSASHPTPTWRTRVSLFVWLLPIDLSGLGGATSSYATAGIALRVSGTLNPHHHDKVGIASVGSLPSHFFYVASSPETSNGCEYFPQKCITRLIPHCYMLLPYQSEFQLSPLIKEPLVRGWRGVMSIGQYFTVWGLTFLFET
jgi:hypothetical protein